MWKHVETYHDIPCFLNATALVEKITLHPSFSWFLRCFLIVATCGRCIYFFSHLRSNGPRDCKTVAVGNIQQGQAQIVEEFNIVMFFTQQVDIEPTKDLRYDIKRIYLLCNFINLEAYPVFLSSEWPPHKIIRLMKFAFGAWTLSSAPSLTSRPCLLVNSLLPLDTCLSKATL